MLPEKGGKFIVDAVIANGLHEEQWLLISAIVIFSYGIFRQVWGISYPAFTCGSKGRHENKQWFEAPAIVDRVFRCSGRYGDVAFNSLHICHHLFAGLVFVHGPDNFAKAYCSYRALLSGQFLPRGLDLGLTFYRHAQFVTHPGDSVEISIR